MADNELAYPQNKGSSEDNNKDLKKKANSSAFKVKYIKTEPLPLAPKPKVRNSSLFWT
jgi:hypothetical protein